MPRKNKEAGAEGAADKAPVNIYQKKTLVDAVAAATGVKKKTVKTVADAVLADLAAALSRGDALNMAPLGKVAVNRSKEGTRADVMILKLRRVKPGAKRAKDEAEAGDEDMDDGDGTAAAE
jgi:DNA-binding protein HU-alpha